MQVPFLPIVPLLFAFHKLWLPKDQGLELKKTEKQ